MYSPSPAPSLAMVAGTVLTKTRLGYFEATLYVGPQSAMTVQVPNYAEQETVTGVGRAFIDLPARDAFRAAWPVRARA